jgi:hypothetical protein
LWAAELRLTVREIMLEIGHINWHSWRRISVEMKESRFFGHSILAKRLIPSAQCSQSCWYMASRFSHISHFIYSTSTRSVVLGGDVLRCNLRSLSHEAIDSLLQLRITFIGYGHYVRK